jgi:hypothetical protein
MLPPGSGLGAEKLPRAAATESVIYSFGSNPHDGLVPGSDLTVFHGVLYGGTAPYTVRSGGGTIFSVTTSGAVLYNFTGGADGEYPSGNLVSIKRTLYGTR